VTALPPSRLVEVGRSFEQTYRPVLTVGEWKVAMLRHFDIVDSAALRRVERHWNTDEVFVLTTGQADLIVLEGAEKPTTPWVFPMETNVAYNIRRSVWHHVVTSRDAHIVLFERAETSHETTDYAELDEAAVASIRASLTTARE